MRITVGARYVHAFMCVRLWVSCANMRLDEDNYTLNNGRSRLETTLKRCKSNTSTRWTECDAGQQVRCRHCLQYVKHIFTLAHCMRLVFCLKFIKMTWRAMSKAHVAQIPICCSNIFAAVVALTIGDTHRSNTQTLSPPARPPTNAVAFTIPPHCKISH